MDPAAAARDADLLSKMSEENDRLKREVMALKELHEKEKSNLEAQVQNERSVAELEAQSVRAKVQDLEKMKMQMVQLTRKLDDEVSAKDQVISETHRLERKLQELSMGATTATSSSANASQEVNMRERTSQVSMKLMRVVDQWMKYKDLQQALLRNAAINDVAFGTLAQALVDCPSLQTMDLSQNLLTMDSCSDLCQLITTAPSLSFISLAENLFSLRCIGYFMTAVMERQTTKRLVPLDLLDLQGNEGLQMAMAAVPPQDLVTKLRETAKAPAALNVLTSTAAVELAAHVMRALWRFLHETQHPQLRGASSDDVDFETFDKGTLHKMDNALLKILLLAADENRENSRALTANAVLLPALVRQVASASPEGRRPSGMKEEQPKEAEAKVASKSKAKMTRAASQAQKSEVEQKSDPFADLKTAFEPVKEKAKTFNLKQIVTRTGTVLMNMLERLLETTHIDAVDVESDMTLLEFACTSGNLGLAKLCYRRGAKMMAISKRGETAFNIVTRNRRYDIMEFLHIYGVKINSADANGKTALHVAAENNDVDGICRLLEWGADVNIADQRKRTPIHLAAAGGHMQATMLLLEVGADMNAKDVKEYTAMAHAEANNHFNLMDRLVQLGAKGHGLHHHSGLAASKSKSNTSLHGGTALAVPAGMLKSTSLGRIGKVVVHGMPGPIVPQLLKG